MVSWGEKPFPWSEPAARFLTHPFLAGTPRNAPDFKRGHPAPRIKELRGCAPRARNRIPNLPRFACAGRVIPLSCACYPPFRSSFKGCMRNPFPISERLVKKERKHNETAYQTNTRPTNRQRYSPCPCRRRPGGTSTDSLVPINSGPEVFHFLDTGQGHATPKGGRCLMSRQSASLHQRRNCLGQNRQRGENR